MTEEWVLMHDKWLLLLVGSVMCALVLGWDNRHYGHIWRDQLILRHHRRKR